MLFKDKKNLLSLYNALNETEYQDETELTVVTLENAVYMGMRNDVAFIFDGYLSLYEHQSTFNPNMPLRFLQYVSREFEKYINKEKIYSSELLRIPEPRFVVFYNGSQEQPEEVELKLSDAYCQKSDEPKLELKVRMYNINYGKNQQLLEKCKVLSDYSRYVETVRRYLEVCNSTKEAVECAVQECIRNRILDKFLIQNRSEVISMSIFEYDEEKVMNMLREEYKAQGLAEGREQGLKQGLEQGLEQGEARLLALIKKLICDNRYHDIEKLNEDEIYRKQLYQEYNL